MPLQRKAAASSGPQSDKKGDSPNASGRKTSPKETVTATDSKPSKPTHNLMSTRASKGVEPALVIETHKNTGELDNPSTKGSGKTAKSSTASAAKKATNRAEPDRPKQQTRGTSLLAQAAMQSSSVAIPETPLTLPLVTPPTLPQQNPSAPPSPPLNHQKRRGVPHTYRDYSTEPDSPSFVRKKTGGVTQPFPEKLHELLTTETDSEDVVGWLPHGRAFIVRKPKVFTSTIMGRYFKQTKLTSFQRQLNLCK